MIDERQNPNQLLTNKPKEYNVPDGNINKFAFNQLQEALIGYLSSIEFRVNEIMNNGVDKDDNTGIPVICHGMDTAYYFRKKMIINPESEIYQSIPRIMVKFEDVVDNRDQNGAQDIKIRYIFNDKTYEGLFRRKTMTMTVVNHFVAANYVRALEYIEIIQSLMRRAHPYTYEFLGNTHQGAYDMVSITMQNPDPSASSQPKDYVINFTCDLQIHLWSVNYSSIREIDLFKEGNPNEGDGFTGGDGKTEPNTNKIKVVINSQINELNENGPGVNVVDNKSEFLAPHNPNCMGCKDCTNVKFDN